jgi:4'-phosphopantetheinyl transferase
VTGSAGTQVHLWLARPRIVDDPQRSSGYFELLSESEREQYFRYRVERARRLHLTARALVRTTLSRYADVEPRDWSFRKNRHGRPEIDRPAEASGLRFNLSHTTDLVACAVSRDRQIGVDVEHIQNVRNFSGIADHSFSLPEADDVKSLEGDDRRRRFFSYWTLKESYIKARGMGLAIPLAQFGFSFPEPGRLAFWTDERLGDEAEPWSFALFRAGEAHYLAVAVRSDEPRELEIEARRVVPLTDEETPAGLEPIAATPAGPSRPEASTPPISRRPASAPADPTR